MEIVVLIEPVPGRGFRARGGEPFALTAEGDTREEALAGLRSLIESRMKSGAEAIPLELPPGENPWKSHAAMFKDDLLFDRWQEAIAARRREADEEPRSP